MATLLKDRLARQAAGDTALGFDPTGRDAPQFLFLPLASIEPDPNQPRQNLGDLTELADSIREQGLVNPIIVEAIAPGRYRILAGGRRHAACLRAGLETVPCVVRTVAEQSRLALQLVENLHRKDLHPLEEARAFQRLMTEFNLTQRDLAQRLGKSLAAVNQTLRLLDLHAGLLADVQTSEQASKSVLLEIAKEPDPVRQSALWQQAQAGQLTVRRAQAEKRARQPNKPRGAVCTVALADATLVIRFHEGESTPERVQAALEQALVCYRPQA